MHRSNPISGLCSPGEAINTLFNPILSYRLCERERADVDVCVLVWFTVYVCVTLNEKWLNVHVEVDTAFGFGALLWCKKKNKEFATSDRWQFQWPYNAAVH